MLSCVVCDVGVCVQVHDVPWTDEPREGSLTIRNISALTTRPPSS